MWGKLNSFLNKRLAGNVPASTCFFCSSSFLPLSGGIWNDALLQTRLKGTTLRWANGSASVEPYYVLVLWRTEREVGWCWTNSHRRASVAWGELAVHKKKAQLKRAERDVEQKQTYSEWKLRFQTLITKILGCAIDLCELKIPDSWVNFGLPMISRATDCAPTWCSSVTNTARRPL